MNKDLLVRIIVSAVAFINAACAAFGVAPLDVNEEQIYTAVSMVAALAAWVWGFWKNNDFTQAASAGTAVTAKVKAGAISYDEALEIGSDLEDLEQNEIDGETVEE